MFLVCLGLFGVCNGPGVCALSAKRRILHLMLFVMSFMYVKNNIGPRHVPCGTPDATSTLTDLLPSTNTDCVRCWRKLPIHKFRLPVTRNIPVLLVASCETQHQRPY